MKILTVRENNNKVNDLFVASDFSILTVEEALNRIDEFKNCEAVKPKNETPYIRRIANQFKDDNLDFLAIQCKDTDSLFFDGQFVYLKDQSETIRQWKSHSGHLGTTSKDQFLKNKGPIPEGRYLAKFTSVQKRDSSELWENRPVKSWGNIATYLEPLGEISHDRDGFFFHGGDTFGSNGCIDLCQDNDIFHATLLLYQRDLELTVSYPS